MIKQGLKVTCCIFFFYKEIYFQDSVKLGLIEKGGSPGVFCAVTSLREDVRCHMGVLLFYSMDGDIFICMS